MATESEVIRRFKKSLAVELAGIKKAVKRGNLQRAEDLAEDIEGIHDAWEREFKRPTRLVIDSGIARKHRVLADTSTTKHLAKKRRDIAAKALEAAKKIIEFAS